MAQKKVKLTANLPVIINCDGVPDWCLINQTFSKVFGPKNLKCVLIYISLWDGAHKIYEADDNASMYEDSKGVVYVGKRPTVSNVRQLLIESGWNEEIAKKSDIVLEIESGMQ